MANPLGTSPVEPALVILAHNDPVHVRRLIAACASQPIVLHVDSKTPDDVFTEMTHDLPQRVILAPRRDARLASWSLVEAELAGVRLALDRTDAEHILVMSGSDYPLTDPSRLAEVFAPFAGRSWIWNYPMPFPAWDVPGFRDGGLWRMRHRFATRADHILWIASKPIFNPIRRSIHPDLEPRASMQWKVLSRSDAIRLLDCLESRPDLTKFGRSTFTPEETFIPSVLASHRLWGEAALAPCAHSFSLANWPQGVVVQHPGWYTADDVAPLKARLTAAANVPESSLPNGGTPLFGRKFSSQSGPELLDAVQTLLW
ncbi:hypothetical protein M6D93_16480 [Jatrophihabitans telluris]|uniref:Peptide O-xylosyltransferase n=1 Tax=Jatrophihabitans telluris TaxID=2038343 RepID=A0ABY4QX05_9ACTN|nr:beta-1,6-N-acetylglucosaminyltransferase [Jatrophihabitans telluris]UQX87884.1 hypothetical protein M6D93_16480 [Jatrophihabitans telluris]